MSTQTIGEVIADCRQRFGIGQAQLAAEADLPIDQLRRFETGLERPTSAEIELLACALERACGKPSEARRMLLGRARGEVAGG